MHLPIQTALVAWLPLPNEQTTVFSVYRSETAIELRTGCERMKNMRLICTHKDYEEAYEFCELLAEAFPLPIQDFTDDRNRLHK